MGIKLRIILMLLPLLLVLCTAVPNRIALYNAGELFDVNEIVDVQQKTKAIYGTAINNNNSAYKSAMLGKLKPEVVVMGSSRSFQFLREFFNPKFINFGGTVSSGNDVLYVVKQALKDSHVKTVFLTLDFWWWHKDWHGDSSERLLATNQWSYEEMWETSLTPIQWLRDGKITWKMYKDLVSGDISPFSDSTHYLGINAMVRGSGFRVDGSYYHGGLYSGREPYWDYQFSDTKRRIEMGESKFHHGGEPQGAKTELIKRAIRLLKEKNIEVITIIPPLAPSVIEMMNARGDDYAYVGEVRALAKDLGADWHFDFHDPRDIGSGDCEFIDGFHGGDITYARMAMAMANTMGHEGSRIFNKNNLETIVKKYSGLTTTDGILLSRDRRELDFLGLGCAK